MDNTVIDVRTAIVKARILTGTYHLLADRDKFHKTGTTSKCPLCSAASEDRLHFLTACVSLNHVRQPYIAETEKETKETLTAEYCFACILSACRHESPCTDCISKDISDRLTLADPDYCEIETASRKLCFALHLKRCSLLKQLS